MHAVDGDDEINWPILYRTHVDYVTVDELTGKIYVNNVTMFDRELNTELNFEITAIESPRGMYANTIPEESIAQVIISLTDRNDEPPFLEISDNEIFAIRENRGIGAEISGPEIVVKVGCLIYL